MKGGAVYVGIPPKGWHITRTMIAGCLTECGLRLKAGYEWTTVLPGATYICATCLRVNRELPAVRHG